ncbi:hypothetical protein FHS19_006974 [Paenibacillus rhizosphaerae]|uniref:Uncharacterized protein n=1 Tax=Paenibacillus rhizosphaerae TaxID=297318 RepID=A0A839TZE3_9BACL|nr:hypothetical protein [Paenibacillus rhizosphaerae]MBB3132245.1 hypothetical protein [Paenibacillus rhizosphaerae]
MIKVSALYAAKALTLQDLQMIHPEQLVIHKAYIHLNGAFLSQYWKGRT